MAYHIIDVETGAFVVNSHDEAPVAFDTGAEASAAAKELAASGRKYRVKRVTDTHWQERESNKFISGRYQPLPWTSHDWWRCISARAIHEKHYPHISKKEPGMIAYTESVEKGMDNIRTWIKPGRYLEKYFSEILSTYGVRGSKLAKEYASSYEPKKVFFAATEDEIQSVYERGPASCMSSAAYRRDNGWGYPNKGLWPDDYHACRTYAAGDLQIAYLLTDDDNPKSKVIARSVVWPAHKTHSRCYGDEVRLKTMLMQQGYTFKAPAGAKLLRKPFKKQFIVPYIDQGDRSGQGALAIKDMKTHLMIVRQEVGTYPANATSGLSGGRYMPDGSQDDGSGTCSRCEEEHPTMRVYSGGASGDYQHWCDDCIEERAFMCALDRRYYDNERMPRVVLADGAIWSDRAFRQNGFTCPGNGKRYPHQARVPVRIDDNGKLTYYSQNWALANTFVCQYTGDRYIPSQKVVMADGAFWSKQAVRHAGFECTTCHKTHSAYNKAVGQTICLECARAAEPAKPAKRTRKAPATVTDAAADEAIDMLIASLSTPEEHP
jgi:hypothetical protein